MAVAGLYYGLMCLVKGRWKNEWIGDKRRSQGKLTYDNSEDLLQYRTKWSEALLDWLPTLDWFLSNHVYLTMMLKAVSMWHKRKINVCLFVDKTR